MEVANGPKLIQSQSYKHSVKFVTASPLASASYIALRTLEPIESPDQTSVVFAYRRISWTKE